MGDDSPETYRVGIFAEANGRRAGSACHDSHPAVIIKEDTTPRWRS